MALPNGEECRFENHRWTERRRRRRTERRRRCRERPLWDPRRWACEIVNAIVDVVEETVHVSRRLVCTAVEAIEEIVPIADSVAKASWGAIENVVGLLTGNATGQLPIIASQARRVPSRPNAEAFGRSMALGLRTASPALPYNQDGAFVALTLVDGVVHGDIGGTNAPLAPGTGELPGFAIPFVAAGRSGPLAVSYDRLRLGVWGEPPPFDLIAAAGDRAIAKATGTDALFMLLFANPYRHRTAAGMIDLPQSYFKLDPECGRSTASRADLLAHVAIRGDDEGHPATERFPLFRFMFRNLSLDIMDVLAAPLIWTKIDGRPRRDTSDPPRRYPTYDHVTYRSNLPGRFGNIVRKSVRYERVLDLGIGSSHLHEQHDNRFGGEADALSGRGGFTGELLVPARRALFGDEAFEAAYRFANGPIEDYGGWVDGTCLYFQLVQMKSDEAIARGEWEEAYAVLWIDEQMSFTERWRVLHPFDRDFTSPFQPILGIIGRSESEFYPDSPFSGERFFCPLLQGHVRPDSRMAVARQHIALTGVDPETGESEVYTIHFSWPTMDKSWRRRPLPGNGTGKDGQDAAVESVAGELRLREDQTLLLPGRHRSGLRESQGWFFQHVLPASGQETPSVAELGAQPEFTAPGRRYSHPWRFVGQDVGVHADATYSHFGVHEAVDGRDQLYQIALHGGSDPDRIERAIWLDADDALRIRHERLNYARLADTLEGLGARALDVGGALVRLLTREGQRPLALTARAFADAASSAAETRTRPSIYNSRMRVRLGRRGALGWTMTMADRRDDKLIGFDALPEKRSVRLVDSADAGHVVEIGLLAHRRNARDLHGLSVGSEVDALSPPAIEAATLRPQLGSSRRISKVSVTLSLARRPDEASAYDRFDEWVASNLWRVRLAAITGERTIRLFDLAVFEDFRRSGNLLEATWEVPAVLDLPMPLEALLSPAGQISYFVSLWGVGPSGLAAIPDELIISG